MARHRVGGSAAFNRFDETPPAMVFFSRFSEPSDVAGMQAAGWLLSRLVCSAIDSGFARGRGGVVPVERVARARVGRQFTQN
jgi:hypothetical protein